MIELRKIINEYPECLNDRNKFRAILSDVYPQDEYQNDIYLLSLVVQTSILKTLQMFDTIERLEINNFCTQLQTKFSIDFNNAFNIVKRWALALDVEFKYDSDFKITQELIEKNFKEAYKQIQWDNNVSLEPCPFYFNNAVTLKRNGLYADANALYTSLYKQHRILNSDFALAWYKTLCCAGNLREAWMLLAYVNDKCDLMKTEQGHQIVIHMARFSFAVEGVGKVSIEEYIKGLSGNPSFSITKDECNIPIEKGIFNEYIELIKKEHPNLYMAIVNDIW